jgi:hypothetical protein
MQEPKKNSDFQHCTAKLTQKMQERGEIAGEETQISQQSSVLTQHKHCYLLQQC